MHAKQCYWILATVACVILAVPALSGDTPSPPEIT